MFPKWTCSMICEALLEARPENSERGPLNYPIYALFWRKCCFLFENDLITTNEILLKNCALFFKQLHHENLNLNICEFACYKNQFL